MRLNEYLQKSLFSDIVPDGDIQKDWHFTSNGENFILKADVLSKIKDECSQIIHEYTKAGKVLFRGSRSKGPEVSPNVYKCIPRTDRKPKDTKLLHHIEMDQLFTDKFGWPVRSSGVFVSADQSMATAYGDLNLFLPANGYKYVWSPSYSDLYSDFLEDLEHNLDDTIDSGGYWEHPITKKKFRYENTFKRIEGYIMHNFNYENKNAIVLYNDKKTNSEKELVMPFIIKQDKDDLRRSWMQNAIDKYMSTKLTNAMVKRNEIIFKCSYFYLIGLHKGSYGYNSLKIKDFGL